MADWLVVGCKKPQ